MEYEATVMIPTYNAEKFIEKSIKSALNQTYSGNYEILIVNDGSTDSTPRIIEEFSKSYPNIRVLHHDNFGEAATRNRLLDNSNAKILVQLDSDDLMYPKSLEEVISIYNKNPEVGFVYTDNRVIDENGRRLYEGRKAECHKYFDDLIYFTHFPGHLRSFRKNFVEGLRFDSEIGFGTDWDFLLKVVPDVKKEHIPEILFDYRINSKGISESASTNDKRKRSVNLLKKNIIKNNLYPNHSTLEILVMSDGNHAIYYEHIVDGKKTMRPEVREVLMRYFSNYKKKMETNEK